MECLSKLTNSWEENYLNWTKIKIVHMYGKIKGYFEFKPRNQKHKRRHGELSWMTIFRYLEARKFILVGESN